MVDEAAYLARSEQATEVEAVVNILARLAGLSELPRIDPDSEPVPVPGLPDAIGGLARATHLPGPQRLELLARLVKHRTESPDLADLDLRPFAKTLVKSETLSDSAMDDVAGELTQRLNGWTEGTEPLGRTLETLQHPLDDITKFLNADIQCTALTIQPGCGTEVETVGGVPALSIVTDAYTCREFGDFRPIVDPTQWPNCWLQRPFFRSMAKIPPATATATPDDGGWRETLLETVDFGFGLTGDAKQEMVTKLDFMFFWNAALPGAALGAGLPAGTAGAPASLTAGPQIIRSPTAAAGCTYDLNQSVDQKILVDQGFLLVEDLPEQGYRRYRTQKEVWFRANNPLPDEVCPFWSVACGLILQGC
jgi:hypothetical protein